MYTGPKYEREIELWVPKNVSREQTRHHVVRDIQDARYVRTRCLTSNSAHRLKKMLFCIHFLVGGVRKAWHRSTFDVKHPHIPLSHVLRICHELS